MKKKRNPPQIVQICYVLALVFGVTHVIVGIISQFFYNISPELFFMGIYKLIIGSLLIISAKYLDYIYSQKTN